MTLSEMMKHRGITQSELAYDAETTQTYISQIKNEKSQPSSYILQKIAGALDCKIVITNNAVDYQPLESMEV